MKKLTFAACLLTSFLAGATLNSVVAQETKPETNQETQPPKGATVSKSVELEATIQDIDYKNRVVTLKGPEGKTAEIKVGQDAPNFNQLKKGDKVKAKYYQSTVLTLLKPGEEATSGSQEQLRTVPGQGGQGPSRMMVSTHRITATVQDIDRKDRTVTLKGPEGNTVQLQVDEGVKGFDQLKPGDQILATYTDALGLSVEREK